MASPPTPRDLADGLRGLRMELDQVEPLAGSAERLSRRLRPERRSLRWAAAGAVAAAAVVTLALTWLTQSRQVAGFVVAEQSRGFRVTETPTRELEVFEGRGVLEARELRTRLEVAGPARLRLSDGRIRIGGGRVALDVEPRRAAEELVAVEVSHGTIFVLGTRFVVTQEPHGGLVALQRGSIRFVATDGQAVVLAPGDELRWPLEPARQDAPTPGAGAPTAPSAAASQRRKPDRGAKPSPPSDAVQVEVRLAMAEIDALRIRRDYRALVRRIAEVLPRVSDPAARESLSYEQCDVLAYRLSNAAEACRQLAAHLRAFPGGRYSAEVIQAQTTLGCHATR